MTLLISSERDRRGELYGHLFENDSTGVPRGLFWNFSLPCAPIAWEGEEWECSVLCEWLQWPVRDWTSLDGATLRTSSAQASLECSIYFTEHHPVRLEALSVSRIADSARFNIALSGAFDLKGYGELDAQNIPLFLHGEVDFDGVVVVPDNLVPRPCNPADVIRLVEPLLNVCNLGEPEWDRFRYVLRAEPQKM
ncbi:hypothetical protein [Hydrogenophaga sp.]|uniref:hypothetical protein n=1 Tax=Hydrogenophaga sp. TaxID=1904254 RepID=UPI002603406D|nr:hypothetical protein [Hydrogenophaga sp.]MDM7950868.1 hypothetical protein [Hydrogenophaga sp.]